ncbi:MAG: class I SAM-dependent methyltransferase [bacterium]
MRQGHVGFDEPTLENHIDARKLEFLRGLLPPHGRAVEIGCGSARLLARVGRATSMWLVAVDRSPRALELATLTAERANELMKLVLADAGSLPFPDDAFDLVLSGGLLEHFEDPRPVLSEMVRVLRVGGVLYADVVPRKLSLYRIRELFRMVRTPWLLPGVFESSLGPGYYRRVLSELGCDRVQIRSAGVYPPLGPLNWARRTSALDGTPLATLLGWYFMIRARRAPPALDEPPAPAVTGR